MAAAKDNISVLVGTFRPQNAEWIKDSRLYNLPLPSCGAMSFHRNVSRIVLIAEGFASSAYAVRFREVVDNAWLKSKGYKVAAKGEGHGDSYALFELTERMSVGAVLSDPRADVFVASSRCPSVKIDADFYDRPYPCTGGKSMPYVFDKLKPYFRKWHSAATFNPFNVVLVQSMAGLPIFSGLGYRLLVFIGVYAILTAFVVLYAKRIEKNPQRSVTFATDGALREKYGEPDVSVAEDPLLKKATRVFVGCISGVLVLAACSFILQRISAIPQSVRDIISYLPMAGMAILFTVGGLCAGRIAGIRGKNLLTGFLEGAKSIAPIAPLIVFVMAITFLMREGKIIDTVLYYIYNGIAGVGPVASLLLISLVVLAMEFFIGSGTAKAFLIMPLVLPLADMVHITRQCIVLGFSVADGLGNILYPTSGVMLIAIGLVGVSYGKYMRFTWKLFVAEYAFCALMLALAVRIGYA